MLAVITGTQVIDFIGKDGSKVKGLKLHVYYEDFLVDGYAVRSFFINEKSGIKLPLGISPNMKVDLAFNLYGKLEGVRKVNETTATTATSTPPPAPPQPKPVAQTQSAQPTSAGLTKSSVFSK